MDEYNRLIAARILDGYDNLIKKTDQPVMFGSGRPRKFVLPGSTEYDYPSSLSVGTMDNQKPALLSGVNEFTKSFPVKKRGVKAPVVTAGNVSNPRKVGGAKHTPIENLEDDLEGGAFNFGKALKSVTKPLGKLATTAVSKVASKAIDEAPMMMMAAGKKKKSKKMVGTDPSTYTPVECLEAGAKPKRTNKRGQLVSKIMKEKGLSLVEASKYIKANNLY